MVKKKKKEMTLEEKMQSKKFYHEITISAFNVEVRRRTEVTGIIAANKDDAEEVVKGDDYDTRLQEVDEPEVVDVEEDEEIIKVVISSNVKLRQMTISNIEDDLVNAARTLYGKE